MSIKQITACLQQWALALGVLLCVPSVTFGQAQCDTYPLDTFEVCYFKGTDPTTGNFLGSEVEKPLSNPVPDRGYGFNREWKNGSVFSNIGNDISTTWRGAPYFTAGRYHFTVFANDGIRLFIDEKPMLDEWQDQVATFVAAVELSEGYHDIRVEWYENSGKAHARLHWDRGPDVLNPIESTIVIDVFVVTRQAVCIVGNKWDGSDESEHVDTFDRNKDVVNQWQKQGDLPKALKPSDPNVGVYPQVECLSLEFTGPQLERAYEQVNRFASEIESWTFGALKPKINIREIQGEFGLSEAGGTSWWLAPDNVKKSVEPFLTRKTDFSMVLAPTVDPTTGHYYAIPYCGLATSVGEGLAGATYSWIPETSSLSFQCLDDGTLLHEFGHQIDDVLIVLMGLDPIYNSPNDYPACGAGDPDTFRWIAGSHGWEFDPDHPWCGNNISDDDPNPQNRGVEAHRLLHHFDPSLAHYKLPDFTGNHCVNHQRDFDETGVDSGGSCPAPVDTGATCELQTEYDAGSCNGTFNVSSMADLQAYANSNFGQLGGSSFKNLYIRANLGQPKFNLDIKSPCRIYVKPGVAFTGALVSLDGRRGTILGERSRIDATGAACLLSEKGDVNLGKNAQIDADSLRAQGKTQVRINRDSTVHVNDLLVVYSNGNLSTSQAIIGENSNLRANNILIKSSHRSLVGKNSKLFADQDVHVVGVHPWSRAKLLPGTEVVADRMGVEAQFIASIDSGSKVLVGDILRVITNGGKSYSRAEIGSEVNIQVAGDMALISFGVAKIGQESVVDVDNNLEMSAHDQNKCTVAYSAQVTFSSESGNCTPILP